MKTTAPKVSVNLPVYNGAAALRRQLQSIADQTFTDFRVIITDNNSTDETGAICREFVEKDARFQYQCNYKNLGFNYSLVRGLYLASGSEYVTYTTHSDYWHQQYLEKCVEVLDSNEQAVLAYSHCQFVEPGGALLTLYKDDFDLRTPEPAQRFLTAISRMGFCTAFYGLMRLSAYMEQVHNILPKGTAADDNVALATLALHGQLVQIDEALYFREVPTHNDSSYEDRRRRLYRMGHGDNAPMPQGGIWSFICFINAHLVAIANSQLSYEEQDRLCQLTVNALMTRYKDQIEEEIKYNVEAILKGQIHRHPIEGGDYVPVGQYKFVDFMKTRSVITMLNLARPFGGERVPGFHHARALIMTQMGYRAEAMLALDLELQRDPTYRPSLELKAQLTSA